MLQIKSILYGRILVFLQSKSKKHFLLSQMIFLITFYEVTITVTFHGISTSKQRDLNLPFYLDFFGTPCRTCKAPLNRFIDRPASSSTQHSPLPMILLPPIVKTAKKKKQKQNTTVRLSMQHKS